MEPPGPGHRRVRGALLHLRRVHVRPVGGVQRHGRQGSRSPVGCLLGARAVQRRTVTASRPAPNGDPIRRRPRRSPRVARIVIMGGGPAGYEAALVAAQHGSDVTVVERDGMGGACVLDDCVPSKTFISSAGIRVDLHRRRRARLLADREAVACRPARGEPPGQGARAGAVGRRAGPRRARGRADHPRHGPFSGRAVAPARRARGDGHARRRHRRGAAPPTSC